MPSSLRAVLAVLVPSAVVAGAAPSLTVKTSAPNVEVDGLQNMKVTVTITNTGDEVLKLLNDPHGVLSSFPEDSFIITNANGTRPSFDGAKVKYDPTYAVGLDNPSVFTVLTPGASTNITHDLSAAYDFTHSGAGGYFIKPSNIFTYVDAGDTIKNLYAAIEDVAEVKLSGNLAVSRRFYDKREATDLFGCTRDQLSGLRYTADSTDIYAKEAYEYLRTVSASTRRSEYWFGPYAPRMDLVKGHFEKISSNKFSSFGYVCSHKLCVMEIDAFVFARDYGVIYICDHFWNLQSIGHESKTGVLIHMSSHFVAHGGTWDYASRSNSRQLAINNPDRAVMNAASHQGFAENDPYQP